MGIPGAANPLLLRRAAAADTAYQIEKSLRFDKGDTSILSRTPSSIGNQRIFTVAFWAKLSELETYTAIFTAGSDSTNDKLQIYWTENQFRVADGFSSVIMDVKVNRLSRDFSAFSHYLVAVDTTQSTNTDRVKIYINGKRETSFATTDWPSQNAATHVNTAVEHWIGGRHSNGRYFSGYLSDVFFIDGLALSPGSFAKFDSAGNWNPKTFALPAPNTGVTFSSTVTTDTGSFRADHGATTLFDGLYNIACQSSSDSVGNWIKFTPATPIPFSQAIDVYQHGNTSVDYSWELADGTLGYKTSGARTSTTRWDQEVILGSGKLKWLKVTMTAAAEYSETSMIRVDGVILRDGFTDPTTRSNPNNGTTWSDYLVSSTGSFYGGMPATNAFNGNLGDAADASSTGGTMTFTPPSVITFDTLEMYAGGAQGGDQVITLTDSSDATTQVTTTVTNWVTVKSGGGTLKSLAIAASGNYSSIYGIRIDGHVLIDGVVDNSFHLKFNDTSRNSAIGKDSLNGKIADATGGLPIYNTTDATGEVKGSGYRADSSAGTTSGTGLILAVPGDSVASGTCDVHQQINTGSSNKTATVVGDAKTSTAESRFYGSAISVDGDGDYITFPDSADFEFGSGAFTVESWVYSTGEGHWLGVMGKGQNSNNSRGCFFGIATSQYADTPASGVGLWLSSNGTSWNVCERYHKGIMTQNTWHHVAWTRDGNTIRQFIDGIIVDEATISGAMQDTAELPTIGAGTGGGTSPLKGYFQDLRIYKGVAKYTANFTPPTRNDWTVTNLSGVSVDGSAGLSDFANIKYTGNGSSQTVTTGSFLPGLVWIKNKNSQDDHKIYDVVNGVEKYLEFNTDDALTTASNGVTAFTSTGFTTGDHSSQNGNGTAYIATVWKTGGAASSNSDGSITSSVSAGDICSVVTWTGTQANGTVGHGLSKAPEMMFVKSGVDGHNWVCYHKSNDATLKVMLNTNNNHTNAAAWNSTAPDDDVFHVGADDNTNDSGNTMTAYCWTSKDGVAKFGSYTGTGSATDTPIQQCGFRPELVIIKGIDTSSGQDFFRWSQASENSLDKTELNDLASITNDNAIINDQSAEALAISFEGFRPKGDSAKTNENGKKYIWAAWSDGTANGAELDVLNDTPTNYEDTSSNVHGNFCAWNPLAVQRSGHGGFRQGNLEIIADTAGSHKATLATMAIPSSGKWYWEVKAYRSGATNNGGGAVGVAENSAIYSTASSGTRLGEASSSSWVVSITDFHARHSNNSDHDDYLNGGTAVNDTEVIGIAVDMDNDKMWLSYANTWGNAGGTGNPATGANPAFSGEFAGKTIFPAGAVSVDSGDGYLRANFGQRSFKYTPPTGFKRLCTQNLDDFDTDNDPSKYVDILKWTGTGSNDTDRKGLAFQPDLVWIKGRSAATEAILVDAVRGATKSLNPAYGADEYTASSPHHEVQAFLSDGVTVGQNGRVGTNGATYVGWFWDVGTAATSVNTAGSLDPSAAWVNTTSGVNILKYTGNGSTSTIGHNLGAKPDWIIVKALANNYAWETQHSALGPEYTIQLQSDAAKTDSTARWNDTEPTASVFTVGDYANTNENGTVFMAYLFTAIPGFSAFGSWIGNGSASDGPFVHLGFRPAMIIYKQTGTDNWTILDAGRSLYNGHNPALEPDTDSAEWEDANFRHDFLSNGFKVRSAHAQSNSNGVEYIYAAWAKSPLKTARAR